MLFETPLPLIIVAAALHLGFRLAYFFWVGLSIRREGQVSPKPADHVDRWKAFKKRAELILNLDGVTFVVVALLTHGTLDIGLGYAVAIPLGLVLCAAGIGTKAAAARVIGVKGYYWYNTFCPQDDVHYTKQGIYKVLDNPMYGVGYLHTVGFALATLSVWSLGFAVFDWAVVWAFNLLFERPHTKRVVIGAAEASR